MPKNTRMTYLYRDADNYKVWNQCVLPGEITEEQIRTIIDACDDSCYFVPSQVSEYLPAEQFGCFIPEVDNHWFEIEPSGFEATEQRPTLNMSIDELVSRFQSCKGNWNPDI